MLQPDWLALTFLISTNLAFFPQKILDIFVLKFTYLVNSCSWYLWLLSVNKSLEFSALCDSWQTELTARLKTFTFSQPPVCPSASTVCWPELLVLAPTCSQGRSFLASTASDKCCLCEELENSSRCKHHFTQTSCSSSRSLSRSASMQNWSCERLVKRE